MGIFKGTRNKTNLTITIITRKSINNYSKVKKDNNNNRQPKCKTSTPIHQSKSTKRKRLFELKSLLHTPIKSPLNKKMKLQLILHQSQENNLISPVFKQCLLEIKIARASADSPELGLITR